MSNSSSPQYLIYEFSGALLWHQAEKYLQAQGYQTTREEGIGTYEIAMDGAAGWGGWYYWLTVIEDPAKPVKAQLDEWLEQSGADEA